MRRHKQIEKYLWLGPARQIDDQLHYKIYEFLSKAMLRRASIGHIVNSVRSDLVSS